MRYKLTIDITGSWSQTTIQSATSKQTPQNKRASFPVHQLVTGYTWKIGGGNNFTIFADQSIQIDGWIDSSNENKISDIWGKEQTNSKLFAQQHGSAYYAANALSNANNTHGMGETKTSVNFKSGGQCYSRDVSAYNSTIISDKTSTRC
jgi:hypothetical protein